MAARVREIVVDSADPAALGEFWSALLGRPLAEDGVTVALDDDVSIVFSPDESTKQVKNRIHLDLASQSPQHQNELVEHAIRLGAVAIDIGQGTVPWVVLADPQGNEFCVLEPREQYLDAGPVAAVVVDALNPLAQAQFWARLLGVPVARERAHFASLRPGSGFWLEFVRVNDSKQGENRVRLGVVLSNGTTLADPEGNEFCIDLPTSLRFS
jgi:catechol 2,3-dioxygenase-like lactoylglutathione lyase family enzyme